MNDLIRSKTKAMNTIYACIVCNHQESKEAYVYHYNEKTSQILRCTNCGHLFIQPIPLINLDDRTMNTIDDAQFDGSTLLQKLQQKFVIEKEIKKVKKILKEPNPKLLDLGCGTGWTTAIWRDHGFVVTGLEPSDSRRKIAQEKYNLEVSQKYIEDFSCDEKFDVVIMRHLFEHIENPQIVLEKIQTFLKPNGVLVIILPNINCIGRYLFKENWTWVLPWHLHYYTPKTLTLLLENNGFTKVKLYQMPSPLWYPASFKKALNIQNSRKNYTYVNLLLCAPIILLGMILNLNDNITLIAKKKL